MGKGVAPDLNVDCRFGEILLQILYVSAFKKSQLNQLVTESTPPLKLPPSVTNGFFHP